VRRVEPWSGAVLRAEWRLAMRWASGAATCDARGATERRAERRLAMRGAEDRNVRGRGAARTGPGGPAVLTGHARGRRRRAHRPRSCAAGARGLAVHTPAVHTPAVHIIWVPHKNLRIGNCAF
jgi:hypothetical protein